MKKSTGGKKQLSIKHLTATACLLTVLLSSTPARAADANDIVSAITKTRTDVLTKMETAINQLNELFIKAFNNKSLTPKAQQTNAAMLNPPSNYQFDKSSDNASQTGATPYDLVSKAAQNSATQKLKSALSNDEVKAQRQVLLQVAGDDKDANAKILDAQNLLGSSAYTPVEQNNAERTVAFLSDYASPFGTIDLKKLDEKTELKDSDSAKEYRVKVYTNAAIRSLLLGNLYDSFNARVPIKGLGSQSGIPGKSNASLVEAEKYIASRRIQDPAWYSAIDTAPSIAVQREMVYLLAEMRWQLYQLHRDNERMLQTMTALGVINLRSSGVLAGREESELKQEIEGTKLKEPEPISESNLQDERFKPPAPKEDKNNAIVPVPK